MQRWVKVGKGRNVVEGEGYRLEEGGIRVRVVLVDDDGLSERVKEEDEM